MTAIDPHRTLGLAPGATQAEIKSAYRHLAKLYHPDSAGERTLPRFLAIQAAYEALLDDPNRSRAAGRGAPGGRSSSPPPPPWQADASRARATREAYRARTRRGAGAAGPSAGGSSGPASGATGGSAGAASARGAGSADGARSADGSRSSRSRRRPKATIGSTSYDGADKEPFDPAWEGATWYGAGSGTYWTLNPKEYADPRKHGPEYQARSRRQMESDRGTGGGPSATPSGPPERTADSMTGDPAADAADATSGGSREPGARRRRGGESVARPTGSAGGRAEASGRAEAVGRAEAAASATGEAAAAGAGSGAGRPGSGSLTSGSATWWVSSRPATSGGTASGRAIRSPSGLRSIAGTLPGRVGLAAFGWLPLGVAVAAASDAVDPLRAGVWIVHLLLIALLVGVPRLGAIAALASASFLLVGLVATPILLAVGGTRTPDATAVALSVVLGLAWLGGVVLALSGRVELPAWSGPRVR